MRAYGVAVVTVLLVGGTLTGCGWNSDGGRGPARKPGFPDAAKTAAANEDPLAGAERITPLPRVAEEHPGPKLTLNLDQAETALSEKPNDPQRNLTLAYVYYGAKAYNDAARAFEKSARLLPSDPQPLLYLGYTQMAVGALDSAIKTFESVIARKDVSRDVQSEAYLQIGNAQGALGNDTKAVEAFTQSLGHNPKQGLASLALGGWAARNKRYGQARDFLKDAVNTLPPGRHQAQAHAALGRVAEAQKDAKTAEAEYKKALGLDADNAWAQDGLKRLHTGAASVGAAGTKPAAKKG